MQSENEFKLAVPPPKGCAWAELTGPSNNAMAANPTPRSCLERVIYFPFIQSASLQMMRAPIPSSGSRPSPAT